MLLKQLVLLFELVRELCFLFSLLKDSLVLFKRADGVEVAVRVNLYEASFLKLTHY